MKKILALVLAVMLIVGMTPVSFAATGDFSLGLSTVAGGGTVYGNGTVEYFANDVMVSDAKKDIYWLLTERADGTITPLTRKEVRDGKWSVSKQTTLQGAKVIKNISIKYNTMSNTRTGDNAWAYVEVEYYDSLVSVKSIDYGYKIYLMKDKVRQYNWEFNGKFKNYEQPVDATFDYIYSYDYPVLKCSEYLKSTKIDAGDGVIINAKLFEGKDYYAKASTKIRGEDDGVLSDHPEIDTIYYLDQVNLGGSGNTVTLSSNDKNLFVYNKDLEFVGMGNQAFPVSSKYYVSSTELDVDDAGDVEAPAGPSEAANPPMGGNDLPANVNDNPGTGR